QEVQKIDDRARLTRLVVDEGQLRDLNQAVQVHLAFEIPGQFGDVPWSATVQDSRAWDTLVSAKPAADRKVPLRLDGPREVRQHYSMQLPAAYRFADGLTTGHARSAWGSYSRIVRHDRREPRKLEL